MITGLLHVNRCLFDVVPKLVEDGRCLRQAVSETVEDVCEQIDDVRLRGADVAKTNQATEEHHAARSEERLQRGEELVGVGDDPAPQELTRPTTRLKPMSCTIGVIGVAESG